MFVLSYFYGIVVFQALCYLQGVICVEHSFKTRLNTQKTDHNSLRTSKGVYELTVHIAPILCRRAQRDDGPRLTPSAGQIAHSYPC